MLVKQPLGQARINVSVVPNTSHGTNKASHVRLPLRGSCALHSSAIFLFTDKANQVRLPMRKRRSPVLYTFVGGLLLNLFLPSYSNLHIYIALSYCFFRNAKKKSCRQETTELVSLGLSFRENQTALRSAQHKSRPILVFAQK